MGERGEYRAIARVLLDGKDFQKMSERARWLLIALKLNLGPSGIEVHYPDALTHQLAGQTGIPFEAVRTALVEVELGGWIRREANIVWVVEQLRYDPHMSVDDPKHRKGIQRHISGLPRLNIVRDFVEHYAAWFDGHTPDPLKALPRALEGPPEAMVKVGNGKIQAFEVPIRESDDREPISENENESDAVREPAADVERLISEVIMTCNRGMIENTGLPNVEPIPPQHGPSRQVVSEWLRDGLPSELIRRVVFDRARAYRPAGRNKQISTLKYFENAVRSEFDRIQAGGVPTPPPIPPDSEAARARKDEKPQQSGKRSGELRHLGTDDAVLEKQEQEKRRVNEWTAANPAEAQTLWEEVQREAFESGIDALGAKHVKGYAEVRFRRRIIDEILTPKLAAS